MIQAHAEATKAICLKIVLEDWSEWGDYEKMIVCLDTEIDHSRTKVRSPQSNGICERFHKTILQEFYQVADLPHA